MLSLEVKAVLPWKAESCSLWSKLLLLFGLLIPHGVFNTHSNNPPLLFFWHTPRFYLRFLSFICFSSTSRSWTDLLHSTSIFHPRTVVAAPRGDVIAKRNHVRDHKTSVLWQARAQSTRNGMCVRERDGKKWSRGWNYLFVYMSECIHMYTQWFFQKIPHQLTSDSRRTINLRLLVKTIFWTWTQAHIGLRNVNVIACNSSHLLSS